MTASGLSEFVRHCQPFNVGVKMLLSALVCRDGKHDLLAEYNTEHHGHGLPLVAGGQERSCVSAAGRQVRRSCLVRLVGSVRIIGSSPRPAQDIYHARSAPSATTLFLRPATTLNAVPSSDLHTFSFPLYSFSCVPRAPKLPKTSLDWASDNHTFVPVRGAR